MSSIPDSVASDSPRDPTRPFDDNDYDGYDSQRFDSFPNFADSESVKEQLHDSLPIHDNSNDENGNATFSTENGVFSSDDLIHPSGLGLANGDQVNEVFVESDGPILPPPSEMQEEGAALREWRRENAIVLEEKEKREKEILSQIIEEANEYKVAFSEKRKLTCENNKSGNREKEKLFLINHEKFYEEADKNYWKSIAELIPNEVPSLEKKGKKDKEKKPSIVVVQGPKPGRPADLSRMRHILLKLKHESPLHLMLTPPSPAASAEGAEGSSTTASPANAVALVASSEAVAAA